MYLTVMDRLFESGSDRSAVLWREPYRLPGCEPIALHRIDRSMGWLGSPLADQAGRTTLGPRCVKDLIEERMFARCRDPFSTLSVVFFDTTALYFEGHAERDRLAGEQIVAALRGKLRTGEKAMVGNKGLRKYLRRISPKAFEIATNARSCRKPKPTSPAGLRDLVSGNIGGGQSHAHPDSGSVALGPCRHAGGGRRSPP